MKRRWLAMMWVMAMCVAQAQTQALYTFSDPQKAARFEMLTKQLRCLVCQNQALAESDAPLALELKDQIMQRVERGDTAEVIVDSMIQRYGDYVSFQPPVSNKTLLLWYGPFFIAAIGLCALVVFVHRRRTSASHKV